MDGRMASWQSMTGYIDPYVTHINQKLSYWCMIIGSRTSTQENLCTNYLLQKFSFPNNVDLIIK